MIFGGKSMILIENSYSLNFRIVNADFNTKFLIIRGNYEIRGYRAV